MLGLGLNIDQALLLSPSGEIKRKTPTIVQDCSKPQTKDQTTSVQIEIESSFLGLRVQGESDWPTQVLGTLCGHVPTPVALSPFCAK